MRRRQESPDLRKLYRAVARETGWTYDEIDAMPRSRFWDHLRRDDDEGQASSRAERRALT